MRPGRRLATGRRAQRAELEATWTVYEPREPGTPFTKKDIADAEERPVVEAIRPTAAAFADAMLARLAR